MNKITEQFKLFVRTKYAWPGGYPMYAMMRDGGCLCHKCASKHAKRILQSTIRHDDKQLEVVHVDINWEDVNMFCDNCGMLIESAYGEESENSESI